MDIDSLTVNGFKSFGKKTVFSFGQNITGIVGPNGSGKSNVTEALRFVMGEQSFKSMRTKEVSDLLFRGADSKATSLTVSVNFKKNKKHKILSSHTDSILLQNTLEKDEVDVTRQVYLDGKSLYKLNNTEVRLKDIQEFLNAISVSNKATWHISQGEADKILLASSEDRLGLIEDALGLRIYHTRIDEAARKLKKSEENIKNAESSRREILPEINFLEKQLERIEKGKEYKNELKHTFSVYSNLIESEVNNLKLNLEDLGSEDLLRGNIFKTQKLIVEKERSAHELENQSTQVFEEKKKVEEDLKRKIESDLSYKRQELFNIQNKLRYLKTENEESLKEISKIKDELEGTITTGNDLLVNENDILDFKKELEAFDNILNNLNIDIREKSEKLFEITRKFSHLLANSSVVGKDNVKDVAYLKSIEQRLSRKIEDQNTSIEKLEKDESSLSPNVKDLEIKLDIISKNIEEFHRNIIEHKLSVSETQRETGDLHNQIRVLDEKLSRIESLNRQIQEREETLSKEIIEMNSFGISKGEVVGNEVHEDKHELERKIERLKVRIEDASIKNSDEIVSQHKNLKEKDEFLIKEIIDLKSSIDNLTKVIEDLESRLKTDFAKGVEGINKNFDTYMKKLFGGGSGKVVITKIEPKKIKDEEGNEIKLDEEDKEIREGIELEVEIPKKKVKGLHSLSGGERALTSIALNLSIVEQNRVPFMVLDETDATLDEANARRYGELLEVIKEKTKLIVITHNRETMAFADEVYGVTLEKSGASKVLSVSFNEALQYSK